MLIVLYFLGIMALLMKNPQKITNNDDDDDKKSLVSWQMTMMMTSKHLQIFLPELLTTICDH